MKKNFPKQKVQYGGLIFIVRYCHDAGVNRKFIALWLVNFSVRLCRYLLRRYVAPAVQRGKQIVCDEVVFLAFWVKEVCCVYRNRSFAKQGKSKQNKVPTTPVLLRIAVGLLVCGKLFFTVKHCLYLLRRYVAHKVQPVSMNAYPTGALI